MELLQGWLLRATPARLGLLGPRSRLRAHHVGSDLRLQLCARPARRLREIARDRGRSCELVGAHERSWELTVMPSGDQGGGGAEIGAAQRAGKGPTPAARRRRPHSPRATRLRARQRKNDNGGVQREGLREASPAPTFGGQRGGVASAGQPLPPPRRVLLERPTGGAAPPLARVRHWRASEIFLGLQGRSSRLAPCF